MESIKPIETVYNGYRFRSRLEARWAVFMDILGIEYRYEPEGFDLGNGLWYLPDFYLPRTNAWVEVKGFKPSKTDIEKMIRFGDAKCDFVNGGAKFRLLLGDIPNCLADNGFCHGVPCYNFLSVDECYTHKIIATKGILSEGLWIPTTDKGKVKIALYGAKKARFEHGECG